MFIMFARPHCKIISRCLLLFGLMGVAIDMDYGL